MDLKTLSGKNLSHIGIGTYGIGGLSHRYVGNVDRNSDELYIDALMYQLNSGMNFTEISVALAEGKSAQLLAQAISRSNLKREDIFITHSLWPKDLLSFEDIEKDIFKAHELFETEILDSTLVTLSLISKFGQDKIFNLLHKLLETNKTRFVSLSNSNKEMIQKFSEEFGERFVAHEAHLSFEIRENKDEGILDLCTKLNVRNNIWRSLRQGKTVSHNWDLLTELSRKYGKSQNQIILNWIVSSGYFPMVFSSNINHIKENIESLNFVIENKDLERINNYRIKNYKKPKVDWDKTGDGISVALLPDKFEENLI